MTTAAAALCLATAVLSGPIPVQIYDVWDGDSFRAVLPGGAHLRIRVLGVDTPERGDQARCAAEAQAAEAARIVAHALLTSARQVTIIPYKCDRWYRLIARVQVAAGDLADLLIRAGHGRPYHGERRAGWCSVATRADEDQEKSGQRADHEQNDHGGDGRQSNLDEQDHQ